jgi:glycosyltransferase involved in cell wall biosynthesis
VGAHLDEGHVLRKPAVDAARLRFSVIIPTLGRTERLGKTLASLLSCDPLPDEVIVVDGDGSEETQALVASVGETHANTCAVHYLRSAVGSTHQRNEGLAVAKSEVVVFVDDDMNFGPTPDLFRQAASGFADLAVVGLTGRVAEPEYRRYGNRHSRIRGLLFSKRKAGTFTRFGYPRYLLDPHSDADVEYMPGGLLFARREPALELRFDEDLTGYAVAEDEDFSYRLSRRGRIRYLGSIVVGHERFGPRDMRGVSRSLVVNRTYLFRKNFDQTPRARIEFVLFIGLLLGHRVVNGDWASFRGLVEGIMDVVHDRVSTPET